MRRFLTMTAVAAIVVASCATDSSESGSEALPINDQDNAASSWTDSSTPVDPGDGIGDGTGGSDLPVVSPDLADEVDFAVADLRDRIGSNDLIEVVAVHDLTWPDGSLGCPEPGMSYTQALVDGYRMELRVGDVSYQYHGAAGSPPFLCEMP